MNKKILILIIIILIFAAGIGAYFVLQKPSTPISKCGDGICRSIEKEKGICPKDCGTTQSSPQPSPQPSNQSDNYSEIISEKIISPQSSFNYWRPEIIALGDRLFLAYNKKIGPRESRLETIEMDEDLNPKKSPIEIYSGDGSYNPMDLRLASDGINLWYVYETVKEPIASCQTHLLNIVKYDLMNLNNKIYQNDVARGCGTTLESYLTLNNIPIDAEAVDDPTPFYFNNQYYVLTRAWHGQRQHVRVFDTNLKPIDEFILDLTDILGEDELSQNALVDIKGLPYLISGIAPNPFFNKSNAKFDSDIYAIPLDKALKKANGNKIPLFVDPSQVDTKVTAAIYNNGYLYVNYASLRENKESFQYFAVFKVQNHQFAKEYFHQFQQKTFTMNHASLAIYKNKLYTVYSGISGGKEVILANVYNLPKNMSTGL